MWVRGIVVLIQVRGWSYWLLLCDDALGMFGYMHQLFLPEKYGLLYTIRCFGLLEALS